MRAEFLRTHLANYYKKKSTIAWVWLSTIGRGDDFVTKIEAFLADKSLVTVEKDQMKLTAEEQKPFQKITSLGLFNLAKMLFKQDDLQFPAFDIYSVDYNYSFMETDTPEAEFFNDVKSEFNEKGLMDVARYLQTINIFTEDYFQYIYINIYDGAMLPGPIRRFVEVSEDCRIT